MVNVVTSVTVTPTANHGDATVTVNGSTVASGSDHRVSLVVGSNVITIVDEGPGRPGDPGLYEVTVDRAESSDAALSGLDHQRGFPVARVRFGHPRLHRQRQSLGCDAERSDHQREFPVARGSADYTASVLNSVDSVTVTPAARENSATVTVNGSTVASGSDHRVSLVVGSNVITIEVTAQDGTTIRIYRVTVTRAADSNAGLSGLTISSGVSSPVVLSPGFARASSPTPPWWSTRWNR